ncbi:hypothetical protein QJS66_05730 [Kocuria rhizophila]|nr:hypothetical protein QJS66_05730 [Kocuria rhizophila]
MTTPGLTVLPVAARRGRARVSPATWRAAPRVPVPARDPQDDDGAVL